MVAGILGLWRQSFHGAHLAISDAGRIRRSLYPTSLTSMNVLPLPIRLMSSAISSIWAVVAPLALRRRRRVSFVRTMTHPLIRVRASAARQWTDQPSRCMKFTRMRTPKVCHALRAQVAGLQTSPEETASAPPRRTLSGMVEQTYLVALKPPSQAVQLVIAATVEVGGEHLVFLNAGASWPRCS